MPAYFLCILIYIKTEQNYQDYEPPAGCCAQPGNQVTVHLFPLPHSHNSPLFLQYCLSVFPPSPISVDEHGVIFESLPHPSLLFILLSSIFSSSCGGQRGCVKAQECVWVAGEKAAGLCLSPSCYTKLPCTGHTAVFRKPLG